MKRSLVVGLASTALLVGCVDTPGPRPNLSSNQNNTAFAERVIHGRLSPDAAGAAPIADQTITARMLATDGTMEPAGTSARTDARGYYELLVPQATSDDEQFHIEAFAPERSLGQVIVVGQDHPDLWAPPITPESTVNAEMLVAGLQSGELCELCTRADIEARVAPTLAEGLRVRVRRGETTLYADFSTSLYAGLQAHDMMLADPSVGVSDAKLQAAKVSAQNAFEALQTRLAAAQTPAEIELAHDLFDDAYSEAYVDAPVSFGELGAAAHSEAGARDVARVSTDKGLRALLLSDVERRRAIAASNAVEAEFIEMGAANAFVERAGNRLLGAIDAAANSGTAADNEISKAQTEYARVVRAELEKTLGPHALGALLGIDAMLDGLGNAYQSAFRRLDASVAARGSVDAVAALRNAVLAESNVRALTDVGVSEADARSALEILFQIEAAEGFSVPAR